MNSTIMTRPATSTISRSTSRRGMMRSTSKVVISGRASASSWTSTDISSERLHSAG
ncbi:hypothetical protein [Nannocystis pusilla]|uniref:hypothetical protein n=1 Tax=Nannocystis pusilla TaxID=889268 RepID=UPI003B7CCAEC